MPGHPPTYTVREERVTAALDHWLSLLTSSDHLDSTVEAVLAADSKREAEPEHVCTARRRQHQLEPELDRVLAAIRAGMDPQLAAAETRKIQKELADAAATITGWEQSNGRVAPLTEDQVRRALTSAEGLTDLLKGLIPIEGVVAV